MNVLSESNLMKEHYCIYEYLGLGHTHLYLSYPHFSFLESKTPRPRCRLAERVGFEPTEPLGSRALQARALGQTTQPLHLTAS